MSGPFTCIVILSCNSIYSEVHGELLVGYCIPGNCSGIVSNIGFLLGSWNGFQEGKVIHGNVGRKCVGGMCFSEKYSRGHRVFMVIIDGVY